MYINKFTKQDSVIPEALKERDFVLTQVNDVQLDETTVSDSSNVEIYILITVGWIFLFVILLFKKWQTTQDKTHSNLENLHPCRTCRFFANNHYVNCAVHPSLVLTKQAINCPDYSVQKKGNFFRQLTDTVGK